MQLDLFFFERDRKMITWNSEKKAKQLEVAEYRSLLAAPVILQSAVPALTVNAKLPTAASGIRSLASGAMVSTTLGFGLAPRHRSTITALHQTFLLFNKLGQDASPSDVVTSVIRYSIGMVIVPNVVKLFKTQLGVPLHLGLMVLHYARLVNDISLRLEFDKFDGNYELKQTFDNFTDQFASCFGNLIMWISNFVAQQATEQISNVSKELHKKILSAGPNTWDQIEKNVANFNAHWDKTYDSDKKMKRGCAKFASAYERIKDLQQKERPWEKTEFVSKKAKAELFQHLPNVFR